MRVLHVAESIKGGVGTYLNQIVPRQVEALGAGSVRVIVPRQHAVQIPDIDSDQIALFDRASQAFREVRDASPGNTDEVLRERFLSHYTERKLSMQDVADLLQTTKLSDLPVKD